MQATKRAQVGQPESPDESKSTTAYHEQVAALAYRLWQERGCPIGTPETDWFQAEQELNRAQTSGQDERM